MKLKVVILGVGICVLPAIALGQQQVQCTNSYTSPPKTLTYTLPPGTLNPGENQHGTLRDNVPAARADIDRSFYTAELTSFNDADCGGAPCRNDIPGVAHRTWPKGSCVVVCSSKSRRCAVSVVMDKGPNTNLRCRTIDANPALQAVLGMGPSDTVAASYVLKSLPPETCKTSDTPANFSVPPASVSSAYGQGTPLYGNPYNPYSPVSASPYSGYGAGVGQGAFPSQIAQPSQGVSAQPGQSGTGVGSPLGVSATPVSDLIKNGISNTTSQSGQLFATGPSAATILVQPQNVRRGAPVIVSWTSVNMRASSCKVVRNDQPFAEGNESSKPDTVPQAESTVTYELTCINAAGDTVRSSATVSITNQ